MLHRYKRPVIIHKTTQKRQGIQTDDMRAPAWWMTPQAGGGCRGVDVTQEVPAGHLGESLYKSRCSQKRTGELRVAQINSASRFSSASSTDQIKVLEHFIFLIWAGRRKKENNKTIDYWDRA